MDITTFSYTGVLILVAIVTGIQGLTVSSSRLPSGTLTIGDNPFTISFTYTKQATDTLFAIELARKRSTDNAFVKIVSFPPPNYAGNATFFDASLKDRTAATRNSELSPTASLAFENTLCTDKADYQWKIGYYDTYNRDLTSTVTIDSLKSLTKFGDDGVLTFTPSTNIVEGTEVTFTCTGDVGDVPAGGLAWYMYRNGETSGGEDLSSQATAMAPVAGQCTYSRTSTLKLTMQSNMNNVVIRCTVQQDVNDEHGDNNAHKRTTPIPVLYAPKGLTIKKEPNLPSYAEGEQKLTLTCSADANPAASYYWVLPSLPGANGTNSTELIGAVLTLTDLNETDSGTYTCVGYNPINGQNNTVNTSVNILIQRTTTTSTTTPSPTSGTTEAPAGNTQTKDDDSKTTTIIILVCVLLGVVIVIVILVILICIKKRKNKKDPMEDRAAAAGADNRKVDERNEEIHEYEEMHEYEGLAERDPSHAYECLADRGSPHTNEGLADRGSSNAYEGIADRGSSHAYEGLADRGSSHAYEGLADRGPSHAYEGLADRGLSHTYEGLADRGPSHEYEGLAERGSSHAYEGQADRGPSHVYEGLADRGSSNAYEGLADRVSSHTYKGLAESGPSHAYEGLANRGPSHAYEGLAERGPSHMIR